MSKVISFRLNLNNLREAEALAILHDWSAQGFSTRQTLIEAILSLDSGDSQLLDNGSLEELSNQIKELLSTIEIGLSTREPSGEISSKEQLSDGFVSSMLKAVKPGLRSDG